jgi:hypothetical protein
VLRNVSSIQYRPGSATMTGFAMHLAYEQVWHSVSFILPALKRAKTLHFTYSPKKTKTLSLM